MKRISKLFAFILVICSAAPLIACQPTGESGNGLIEVDPNKEQIKIHVSNGGYGYQWLIDACNDWNALNANSDYQAVPYPSAQESPQDILDGWKSKTGDDIYFMSHPSIFLLIREGAVEPLDSVLAEKPDGAQTLADTLKDKEYVYETFEYEGSVYAIPYGDSFYGILFDFDTFMEKEWLLTDEHGNLTVGKDGVADTYDDGQPVTMAEWNEMLDKIKSESNSYPFIFNTQYYNYMDYLYYGVMAQYAGHSDYQTFINYQGSYSDETGNTITVPLSEGYKVYDMPAVKKTIDFIEDNFFSVSENVYPGSYQTLEFSHRDAQDKFLIGYKQNAQTPLGAMLLEGIWWENEAKSMFEALKKRGEFDRAFGKREYRYMLYPDMEGQKGGNGDGTGSVFAAMDAGAAFMMKTDDAKKAEMIKDFFLFAHKQKYLKAFTLNCGAVRPFNYTLTDEEYEKLTPFQQNVWDMYRDKENISFVRPTMDRANDLISNMTTKNDSPLYAKYSTAGYGMANYLSQYNAATYYEGLKKYNVDNWATFMAELNR